MSSTDPPTSPSTATIANGTRNQVGSSAASAPIGFAPIAVDRLVEEPASSRPKISSPIGATAEPNGAQPITPGLDQRLGRPDRVPADHAPARRVPGQVARVVGRGVDPAETEAGHHEHQRPDQLLRVA